MVDHRASLVRRTARRSKVSSLANTCSIGLQVWRVGRQVEQADACGPDGLLDTRHLVGIGVVQDRHVAVAEHRGRDLLDMGQERRAVHRTIQHRWGNQAGAARASNKGRGAPVTVRGGLHQALAPGRPALAPDHVRGGTGLVDEHEARDP